MGYKSRFRRLNPELEATKLEFARLTERFEAVQQELEWMTNERNKLHNMVQGAREAFQVMHAALYPDQVYMINVEWDEKGKANE